MRGSDRKLAERSVAQPMQAHITVTYSIHGAWAIPTSDTLREANVNIVVKVTISQSSTVDSCNTLGMYKHAIAKGNIRPITEAQVTQMHWLQ